MSAAQNWYDEEFATFGDRLAAAREAAGMSQEVFAKRLGVKLSTLRKWEDDLAEPRANRLAMISGILGVSMPWLISSDGDGLEAPGHASDDTDMTVLLTELRDLRVSLAAKAEHVGRIEKRVRQMLRDAADA